MFHVKVEVCPALIVIGFAVKLFITGDPPVVTPTVTVAVLVTEPALLVAVSVYVVVIAGFTSIPN